MIKNITITFSDTEAVHVCTVTLDGKTAGTMQSSLDHGRKGSRWAAACDVLESMILALASAGVSEEIIQSVATTTMDAIANNYGDY